MDYTRSPLLFRIRKALRYTRLFGVRRTLAKVRGQYHVKRRYACLPQMPSQRDPRKHVGIIGCGNFAFSNIAFYLRKNYGAVIRGVMDHDIHHAASLFQHYSADYYSDRAEKLVDDPGIDLVFIASNHASHAEYAIEALKRGKSVHIEKPHVVSEDQLVRLVEAMDASPGNVTLGFNRPGSRIGREIKRQLDAQSGAAMFNWFIAGHEIPGDHWYFRPEEGGRILGNLCHWTDFLYHMVPAEGRYPITIRPARAEKSDCDIAVSYVFGDGSIGVITFSAKGHTFEGVRERFAAHRGDALIAMDDFKELTIDVLEQQKRISLRFRDHGHESAIRRAYALVRPEHADGESGACTRRYVWETAELFLKTRTALEEQRDVVVHEARL
jgi:predicted dehydrogenase